MGVGRFFCVALPLILTIASIVALLVATLSGVAHNQLWLFRLNTTDLSISPADAQNIAGKLGIDLRDVVTENITAGKLGLADVYEVDLWGYCYTGSDGKRQCTKAKFDWASSALNTSFLEAVGTETGVQIKLPTEIQNALKAFRTVSKWTEVVFIVALVALGVELVVGIFSNCSRVVSCLTYLIASVTAILVGAAAGMATAMAAIVIGAVESTAKFYGVKGSIGTRFLVAVWMATAFAIGAALFWLFTICCCKPEHRNRGRSGGKRHLDSDSEKLLPAGAYRPLSHNNFEMTSGTGHHDNNGFYNPNQYSTGPRHPSGQGRTDLAYEPYSHRA